MFSGAGLLGYYFETCGLLYLHALVSYLFNVSTTLEVIMARAEIDVLALTLQQAQLELTELHKSVQEASEKYANDLGAACGVLGELL